ncbi:hypothetical protein AMAG_12061 [Allomyces macrogynus ATCC 38327]|uniref:EF-hand domain-containing protein n=1 Tax=Allomyces macrogynus (strain ATCC 38327) TaxID=578462 RepID=A0A0L0SYI6_ALLM3|nr:hypothetical protein AMAG_12061 [Allomyces macrogynus ATCC 38327]|eukprot:KNE67608.1 hypothetical protein AMAG_12061 [Allomyces macrogynus ATCC 38327]
MGHAKSRPRPSKDELAALVKDTHFTEKQLLQWYDAFVKACTAHAHPHYPNGRDRAATSASAPARGHAARLRASSSATTDSDASVAAAAARAVAAGAPRGTNSTDASSTNGSLDALPPTAHSASHVHLSMPHHHATQHLQPALDRAALRAMYARFFPFGDARAFADRMFAVLDTDRDGLVQFREFVQALAITSRTGHVAADDRLHWAFRLYDVNDDGLISRDEVLAVVQALDAMLGPLATSYARPPPSSATTTASGTLDPSTLAPPPAVPLTVSASAPVSTDGGWLHGAMDPAAAQQRQRHHVSFQEPARSIRDAAPTPAAALPLPDPGPARDLALAQRVDYLFAVMDRNGDGRVGLGEFMSAARAQPVLLQALSMYEGMV